MKYTRLSKEQFEELHKEFINFLATQKITADEWSEIKANKPQVAEQQLDVFSDLVWEGVLNQAKYVEHISANQMHLFCFYDDYIHVIAVKVNQETVDITTKGGYNWLRENLMDEAVEFLQASKPFSGDKNLDKFKLIQQGGVLTKGELYSYFNNLIN